MCRRAGYNRGSKNANLPFMLQKQINKRSKREKTFSIMSLNPYYLHHHQSTPINHTVNTKEMKMTKAFFLFSVCLHRKKIFLFVCLLVLLLLVDAIWLKTINYDYVFMSSYDVYLLLLLLLLLLLCCAMCMHDFNPKNCTKFSFKTFRAVFCCRHFGLI